MKQKQITELEKIIGYQFKNKDLLVTAFTHSSYANLNKIKSNERLEFLGDTVLSTIISEKIYYDKDYNEGQLSKLRSKIVSMKPLSQIAERLGLVRYLQVSGCNSNNIITDNMKADLVEATIGAIFIDGGLNSAKKFVKNHFLDTVKQMEELKQLEDAKSFLQEQFKDGSVKYTCNKSGSDHSPIFTATVIVNGEACGKGTGTSKRIAETKAAEEALKKFTKV